MRAALMVARRELRRRWRSLAGLALLVAIVSAGVTTSLVGAQRASSAIDRFREWAVASDLSFQGADQARADLLLETALGLPEVAAVAERRLVNAWLIDNPVSDVAVISDPADRWARQIDRPMVLEGRTPAPDVPDEIMLNELAAELTGLTIGDHVAANTWSADDLLRLFDSEVFPGFHGPVLHLEVVGIGRFVDDVAVDVQRTAPYAWASPAFLDAYAGVGTWPGAVDVRLAGPGSAERVIDVLAPLQNPELVGADDAVGPSYSPAVTAEDHYLRVARDSGNSLAAGLLVFAAAAMVLGGVALAQGAMRIEAALSGTTATMSQLGQARSATALIATIPVAMAGVFGALGGAAVAVALSTLLPIGDVRRAEIEPGPSLAPAITLGVAALMVATMIVFTFVHGRWWRNRSASAGGVRRSRVATLNGWGSLRPSTVIGVQSAVDPGRGPRRLPVRSAIFSIAVGLSAVVAASVLSGSYRNLDQHPAWWGWNWSSQPDVFTDREPDELIAELAADPRVDAVGQLMVGSVFVGGTTGRGHALDAFAGDITLTKRRGRLPRSPAEVALGEQTAADLGASIGDTVDAFTPGGGTSRFTVVGTVVFPYDEERTLDVGFAFTPEGLRQVELEPSTAGVVLTYAPGLDRSDVERGLSADHGLEFTAFAAPHPPAAIRNLAFAVDVARALALFFAVLGVLGLTHALVISTGRRRTDFAILRALGFERGQVRWVVLVQAMVLLAIALVAGVPLGVIIGRLTWGVVTSDTGAIAPAWTPWWLFGALIPVSVAIAVATAWWPGRVAARRSTIGQLNRE